ncbi:MAG TPA: AI-2E family transporter [Longimicrobiaceae bacterium]|jgi:predicted PurR-regulated permease PerM|nr:AI-2E family transporter [Longimicrobiaceae bacterium]
MPDQPRPEETSSVPPAAVAARREPFGPVPLRPEHLYKAVGLFFLFAFFYRFFAEISHVLLLLYATAILAVALNALIRRLPAKRKWMTAAVGLFIFACIGAALTFGIGALIGQVRSLAGQAPMMETRLHGWEGWLRETTGLNVNLISPETLSAVQDNLLHGSAGKSILGKARGLVELLAIPVFILFGGLFAVANPNRNLLDGVMRVAPRDLRPAVRRILELLAGRILGWLKGTLIGMACVGALSCILFWIIGVPNALLLGVISGIAEFIPLAGPWIGGLVATSVAFLDSPTKGMWTAVAAIGVQQFENHIIIPWAMSKAADVHPLVTIFALLLFGSLFGFLGVVLAIPLVLLFWTIIEVLWVERAIDTDGDHIHPVVSE